MNGWNRGERLLEEESHGGRRGAGHERLAGSCHTLIVAVPTDVISSSSHALRKGGEARTHGRAEGKGGDSPIDSPVQSPLRHTF